MADVNIDTELGDALATTAAAGERVFPVARPQSPGYPCISWTRISGPSELAFDRTVLSTAPRFQVDCWALSFETARQTVTQAKTAVLAYLGVVVPVYGLAIEDERDDRNPDTGTFRSSFDVVVTHG